MPSSCYWLWESRKLNRIQNIWEKPIIWDILLGIDESVILLFYRWFFFKICFWSKQEQILKIWSFTFAHYIKLCFDCFWQWPVFKTWWFQPYGMVFLLNRWKLEIEASFVLYFIQSKKVLILLGLGQSVIFIDLRPHTRYL